MGSVTPIEKLKPPASLLRFRRTLAFQVSVVMLVSWSLLLLGSFWGNYRALEGALSGNARTTIAQTSQLLNLAISAASNQQGGDLRTIEAFLNEIVTGSGKSGIVYVVVQRSDGSTPLAAAMSVATLPVADGSDNFEGCAMRGICHIRNSILLFGSEVGFLQYGLATETAVDALARANAKSLVITIGVTLMIFAAIAVGGLGVARRIARLNRASNAIAKGNYSVRVKVDGSNELSDLSTNFNHMAESIETSIAEISGLKEGLEARVRERTEALNASNRLLAANVAKLESAREQLVKSEKLASLGALVAGVSHELNTPIGNALVATTTVHQKTVEFAATVAQDKVSRKALETFLTTSIEGNVLTERALRRAVDLISSFKMVAVDQASERRREFQLAQIVKEVIKTFTYTRKLDTRRIEVDVDESLKMDSFPGPLVQVLSNLFDNALTHAFDNREEGEMYVSARWVAPDRVSIAFSDNGNGIAPEHIRHVFDPFFTTKLGQGGSGLGLNIVNNIVEGLLGGSIRVDSQIGVGTRFTIDLPLVAPH